ncbi:MAG: phosphatase PAP2 family protein [Clostridia bacterium]|nr:phosphatase PAP2 family protein [Clostridia bacterium]
MTKHRYMAMKHWFLTHRSAYNILKILYTALPTALVVFYPVMVVFQGLVAIDGDFVKMLCVPAGVLVAVTLLRKLLNRPRPYEKYATPPLIKRDGRGCSMPSRHTASAFIIAMCGFLLSGVLGITLLCIAFIIGLTRILAGVHYISDVVAGAAVSLLVGYIFFMVI